MASLRSDIRGTDACCRLPTMCRIGPNLSGICGCVCLGCGGLVATTDGKSMFSRFWGVAEVGGRLVWGAEMQAGAVGWEAGIRTTTASSRVCVLSLFLLNVK
jgi:hypothetical protein